MLYDTPYDAIVGLRETFEIPERMLASMIITAFHEFDRQFPGTDIYVANHPAPPPADPSKPTLMFKGRAENEIYYGVKRARSTDSHGSDASSSTAQPAPKQAKSDDPGKGGKTTPGAGKKGKRTDPAKPGAPASKATDVRGTTTTAGRVELFDDSERPSDGIISGKLKDKAVKWMPTGVLKIDYSPQKESKAALDKLFDRCYSADRKKHFNKMVYILGAEGDPAVNKVRVNIKPYAPSTKITFPPNMNGCKKTTLVRHKADAQWEMVEDRVPIDNVKEFDGKPEACLVFALEPRDWTEAATAQKIGVAFRAVHALAAEDQLLTSSLAHSKAMSKRQRQIVQDGAAALEKADFEAQRLRLLATEELAQLRLKLPQQTASPKELGVGSHPS